MKTTPSHVLIADDNEINRIVAREILGRLGLDVEEVADGALAIDAVAARPPALVLMDVQMPVMDGLEATRRLRAAGFGDLPILAFTAPATPEDLRRIEDCGMSGLVAKPIDAESLTLAIRQWLPEGGDGAAVAALSVTVRDILAGSGEVDPDAALALAEGDPDLLVERLRGFVDLCAETSGEIADALMAGNARHASALFLSLRLPCADLAAHALARDAHSIGLGLLRADPDLNRAETFLMRFEGFLAQLSEAVYG